MKHFIFSLSISILIVLCCVTFANAEESTAKNTMVWWGGDFVELHISNTIVAIDPYGGFSRKANLILVTHSHYDHCHVPSLQAMIATSNGAAKLIVGSVESNGCLSQLSNIEKRLANRRERIKFENLVVETIPSWEDGADLGYIVRDSKTKLSVLHLGDNNRYTNEFKNLPQIDYLFLAMGKMSYADTVLLLKDIKPTYLIPMHYRPLEGNLLTDGYSFPVPDDSKSYLAELDKQMKAAELKIKILIAKPGSAIELVHPISNQEAK